MTPAQAHNFERLLNPRHIAFVGGADAAIAIGEARRAGFKGRIWAVNPRRADLAGVSCVAEIDALPEAPDAVYLAIPAEAVIGALRRLSAMGAGGVVCYSAGFREAHEEGAALEDALRAAAGDMALIGPNCYGVINYVGKSALWPFAHGGACPGGQGAAIITQSGMFSSDITMSRRSLPLAYMVSGGNQAVLGIEDFVEAFAARDEVRAIGVHIEGLRDVPRFERAALAALERGVPVVALKTGHSAIGAALAQSHTGSLSGTRELYEALFARTGVISVASPAQFLETLKYLCVAGAPKGRDVAGFTCSGGGAAMLADHAEQIGLRFPGFDAAQAGALGALLPPIATVSNPLDYTTPIWGQAERTYPAFRAAMDREGVQSAILVQDYPAAGLDESLPLYRADAGAFARAARDCGLPAAICSTIPENMDAETRDWLIGQGVAPMQGIHEALNAVLGAADWAEARARIRAAPPPPLCPPRGAVRPSPRDEAEGKAWVRACGLAVPEARVTDAAGAAKAARDVGFPVALKMLSAEVLHKTEAGAVAVGLDDAAAVARAVAMMQAEVTARGGAFTDRLLIEAMAPRPIAELLVSVRRDAQFGLALTIGSGGTLTELLQDAVTVLLPAGRDTIAAALGRLRVARLVDGYRGGARADLAAVADAIHLLCKGALAQADTLDEIEINPLFVFQDHCVAIDAVLKTAAAPAVTPGDPPQDPAWDQPHPGNQDQIHRETAK
ncbi:CoA-binding protein [Roseovarius spongiae]|uniref:CoA-binding protein n=1 Tax=Roseovarius spongiae TaxID=2320272 RepID=A0A3A8AY77_9RHOB|nr:acetate--CoA ligase family protein [Roseovarius spongiae]RKF16806.1 CoA-binding protein [Roseovarius spongiae]